MKTKNVARIVYRWFPLGLMVLGCISILRFTAKWVYLGWAYAFADSGEFLASIIVAIVLVGTGAFMERLRYNKEAEEEFSDWVREQKKADILAARESEED